MHVACTSPYRKYNGNKPNVYRVQENLVVRLYILGCDEADVETMNKPENHMDFMLNSNGLNKKWVVGAVMCHAVYA